MCGINGIFTKESGLDYSREIRKMNHVLRHRGPNDEGVYEDKHVHLGHRRLSIVDLSSKGRQPMTDSTKSIWVVCNGEIYNFKELRKILEGKGFIFHSDSDTEVIVHGYKEWGTEIFSKLEGMFAFALWDKGEKWLWLVRDGCGVKPLFYFLSAGKLLFSSEIKGLLASGLVEPEINSQSLSDFLSLAYIPNPETILKNVQQVPPGTAILFSRDMEPKPIKFWDLGDTFADDKLSASPEKIYDQLREEVSLAVDSSLLSDIPLSLLLSSGIDSSIILNELKNQGRKDIETVTIGFEEPSYDESKAARKFAQDLQFKNHTFLMSNTDVPSMMEKVIYHLDVLNANPCILAEYLNFQKVSERFHVTLMGTGNDELFAGYLTHLANAVRKYYGVIPLWVRRQIFELCKRLPVSNKKYSLDYLAYKFAQGGLFPRGKSHYWWRTMFSEEEKMKLLKADFLTGEQPKLDAYYIYEKYFNKVKDKLSFEDQTLYADFNIFLIDNSNLEVDQLSMAFSLEARPPFLTKRFAEFAFRIPYFLKTSGVETKKCLKEAYKGILPDYILKRKKQGLVAPLSFLFEKDMDEFLSGYLLSQGMLEFFNKSYIEQLIRNQRDKRENNSYKLFTLLCFSVWLGNFIKPGLRKNNADKD